MTHMPKETLNLIDVIIVNYNSEVPLHTCIHSLYRAGRGIDLGIMVQDNGSGPYRETLMKAFPEVRWVRNSQNLGFARAVNQGIRSTRAPYLLILNPDTFVLENLFQTLLAFMQDHPRAGIIGPKILYEDGSVQESARSFPNFMTGLFGRTSLLSRWFPNNPLTRQNLKTKTRDGKTPFEVDWVSGACMFVRREATAQTGLMDERFFMYWEDADWCQRMWANGWRIAYVPLAAICHSVGKSSETRRLGSSLNFHVSSYRYYAKHAKGAVCGCSAFVALALATRFLFKELAAYK